MENSVKSKYEMDLSGGRLFVKILRFSLPLMLSGILQLMYNAADIIVVGRFAGKQSLAAVGSTTALINLTVNVFIGISVGSSVVIAKYYGAKNAEQTARTVHTSMLISVIGGLAMGLFGVLASKLFLTWMGTPDDVIDLAAVYLKIYFAGMPFNLVYNFGAAILRGIGDTRRPLYYLSAAGIINVLLNLLFVINFGMGVSGVAVATVISQAISAVLVTVTLIKSKGNYRLYLSKLRIHKEELVEILKVGLPAGFQGAIFSISNVIIQSSINGFGSTVMAGNAAASNIEGFVYVSMNSVYHAALAFTGQSYGAGKSENFNKILYSCLAIVVLLGVVLSGLALALQRLLMGIYTSEPEVIEYGVIRLTVILSTYFLCGVMDVLAGQLRGIGYSLWPMAVSVLGVCAFRIIWVYTAFKSTQSLTVLYLAYPISWIVASAANAAGYFAVIKKVRHKVVAARDKTLSTN